MQQLREQGFKSLLFCVQNQTHHLIMLVSCLSSKVQYFYSAPPSVDILITMLKGSFVSETIVSCKRKISGMSFWVAFIIKIMLPTEILIGSCLSTMLL